METAFERSANNQPTKGESLIANTPINLGIKKLKRELRTLYPDMAKSAFNRILRAYKKRSWSEYGGVVRHRGHFPAHPSYRTSSVKVTTKDEEITTIKVRTEPKGDA